MTQITREEAIQNLQAMIGQLETRINELSAKLSVKVIDDQPYVVVMDTTLSTPSALKRLGANSWNMTAQGLDAATFGLAQANVIAEHHGYKVMKKREWYQMQIDSAMSTIVWAHEIMQGKAA
jgi:hypothetical protein